MKLIKSLLLGLLLGLIFLIILSISVSLIYQKQVTQYIVEELNQSINIKINIEDAKFSLLRKFPNASVEFRSVTAYSPAGFKKTICTLHTDTLFTAKRLFLEFNLFDLFSENYTIKNIHFDQGIINLFVDEYGFENYRFWDSANEPSDRALMLELTNVKITQTHFSYCNEQKEIVGIGTIEKSTLNGLFYQDDFTLNSDVLMQIDHFSVGNQSFIVNKQFAAKLIANINNEEISFSEGDIVLDNFRIRVTGDIQYAENVLVDLFLDAQNQSIESFNDVLPDSLKEFFNNINFRGGMLNFSSAIEGMISETSNPKIDGTFLIKKASFVDLTNNIKINQIYTDGSFSNGLGRNLKTSFVKLNSFSSSLEKSTVSGSSLISDLSDPSVMVDYSAELDFEEIHRTFSIDTLEILSGKGKVKGTFSGNLKEIKNLKLYDFFKKEFAFNLRINNGQLKLKGNPLTINNIGGVLAINETLYTDSLYFRILDNDFLVTGEATSLYNYFSSGGTTAITADLVSESIDLNQLSPLFFVEKTETLEPSYKFPERLNLNLYLQIKTFTVGKFNATTIKGNLNYKPKMFSLHEISFRSMTGESKIGGVIIQNFNNDFLVRFQSNLKNIDINQLFYSFNNFGQTFLPEKNIQGSISGDIYFSSLFSDKLDINKKSIISESNITIKNGALVNYEPLKRLSKFIDVKELEHIKFSTLQNQITIKDEKVAFPKMDISSSAINITIYGTHNFNNTFDYHFKVLLSDILAKGAKDAANKANESENIEEDGLGKTNIYLKITGTPDDYKISYDRRQAREARKEELQNEKKQLRKILNEEFGWFKKDSQANPDTLSSKSTPKFKIEWDENPAKMEPIKKETEKKKDPKFEISFDEDTTNINRY